MRILFSFIIILIISISTTVMAKPKVVPTTEEIFINPDPDSPPIAFQRLVFNVPETQELGRGGLKSNILGCMERYKFSLESNTFDLENRIFVNST